MSSSANISEAHLVLIVDDDVSVLQGSCAHQACGQESFASAQQLQPSSWFCGMRHGPIGLSQVLPMCRLTLPFEGHTNYAQQVMPVHRLAQKSHCSGTQRLVFLFLARVGAEEDHGNTRPNFLKTALQLQSI